MRYYMIKVREYGPSCDCTKKNEGLKPGAQGWTWCNHPRDKPTDGWHFWKPQGCRIAALYSDLKQVKRSMPHAQKSWRGPKKETKVVFFESEDLLEVTEDRQLAFEQAEAKMLRAGELADEAQAKAGE